MVDRDVLFTDKRDQQQAQELVDVIARSDTRLVAESGGSASALPLPGQLAEIVAKVVDAVASGRAVTVTTLPEELTTTVAAQLLGISRPTLMRKIKNGDIPARRVGSHTRLRAEDVMQERRARRQRQLAAFDELRDLEEG